MKRNLLSIGITALAIASAAAANPLTPQSFAKYVDAVNQRALSTERSWQRGSYATVKTQPSRIVTQTDGQIGPVSNWGSLYTPEGEEWLYSAEYTYTNEEFVENITGATFTIYNSHLEEYAKFSAEFTLGEGDVAINSVQMAPTLTKKFFNINDSYEVMIYVHAVTEDYTGNEYTMIYSLADGQLITTIPGNNIAAVNTATDPWSERYTMVFMREEMIETPPVDEESYPTYEFYLHFDIYSRAGWGTGCSLDHTFTVDYQLVAGAGNYAMPMLVNSNNGKLYYALPRYEKPYFESSWTEDITPDNHFIIDLYDQEYNLVRTTSIPMELEGDAYFSFPGMGELYGNGDLDFSIFTDGSGDPMYIIGVENYITSIDDFSTSLYYYDVDGNRLGTIVDNAMDYISLSDIIGQEQQWCFYFANEDAGTSYFSMVDVPSCTERARINTAIDDSSISASIDRVPFGATYNYVSSLNTAIIDNNDNVIHRFAWFADNGDFMRFDCINLGKKAVMALPYVNAEAFDPYLFNTDNNLEYMFLVKELQMEGSSKAVEYLRVYNDNSDLLLDMGPDPETGDKLNAIFLFNPKSSDPKLVITYSSFDDYSIRHVDLPFSLFSGGDGTAASPYQIATPGDLMSIYTNPASYYELANDIECNNVPMFGNNCNFTGVLNGNGHTISNLSLIDNGIFSQVAGTAKIYDFTVKDAAVNYNGNGACGIIASNATSNGATGPVFQNITIDGANVTGNSAGDFGCIIGYSTIRSSVKACNLKNITINLPRATVGGVAGIATTGSSIEATYFGGSIYGSEAGGIVGNTFTGDETITNCHVDAAITGRSCAGGIVANSSRALIKNCWVDGTVTATGTKEAYAGGVVGSLQPVYNETNPVTVIENCIVAATVSTNTEADRNVAHRIAGFTSGDELLVDWESTDPSVDWTDPSTYPYYKGAPEKDIHNNFALDIPVIDDEVADSDDTPEGKSITLTDLTDDFYAAHGWLFGNTIGAPWKANNQKAVLYFEQVGGASIPSVAVTANSIRFDGTTVSCKGSTIEIYDIAGHLVAKAYESLDATSLAKGIYVARTNDATLKFIKK